MKSADLVKAINDKGGIGTDALIVPMGYVNGLRYSIKDLQLECDEDTGTYTLWLLIEES